MLTRRDVVDLLARHDLAPSRALGQNFVVDPNTVRKVVDLAGVAPGDPVVEIGAGLGSLTLRVPRGVGLQVTKDGFLASFDSEGLVKRGSGYYSLVWDTAPHRLTVRVDAAFGSINLQWIEPATASRP